jgi:hypothetical protein
MLVYKIVQVVPLFIVTMISYIEGNNNVGSKYFEQLRRQRSLLQLVHTRLCMSDAMKRRALITVIVNY